MTVDHSRFDNTRQWSVYVVYLYLYKEGSFMSASLMSGSSMRMSLNG